MKRLKFAIATIAIALFATPATIFADGQGVPSPEQFIADWAAAFNKNDPALLIAFYDESEQTTLVMSAGVLHQGYRAIGKAYKGDVAKVRFYDSTAKVITTKTVGDTAMVTFEHRFKTEFIEHRSHWQVHIRTTTVLDRSSSQWKIVLEHSSPIQGTERYTEIKQEVF